LKAFAIVSLAALAFIARSSAQYAASASIDPAPSHLASGPVVTVDFTNPGLSPSHWTLTLHPDGSGHFVSEMGNVVYAPGEMRTPSVNRDIQLNPGFAASVFQTAKQQDLFNKPCESHLKVAFQGNKTLGYSGPEGKGACTFNYSKDHEIQELGDNMTAVAETIIEGARLEMFLQHDPLGLDKEIAALSEAADSGRAKQLCAIRAILEKLVQDDHVLDLVRKRARTLLAKADA
jgi:hypothetical protein